MSLQSSAMFEKYHRVFQASQRTPQRYQFVLSTGHVFSGVPGVVAGADDKGTFTVTMDDGRLREVGWDRLLAAAAL